MYGAAVVDALGSADFISASTDGMINGALAGFDNQGGFEVGGVGFQMAGSGGMVGGFHAVPEPTAIAAAGAAGLAAICGLYVARRRTRGVAARRAA
jgi:hypothetical protein